MNALWDRRQWLFLIAVVLLALVAMVSAQLDAGVPSGVVYQSF